MKINKLKPLHWVSLIASAMAVIISLLFRPFRIFRNKPLVILYGHKLNGNLKAFYDYYTQQKHQPFELIFLTMDRAYYLELKQKGVNVSFSYNLFQMLRVGQGKVMITSHGDHVLFIYRRLTSMKYVDVRHGIPYKGYDRKNFKKKRTYTQEWLSSEYFKNLYIEKYGFRNKQIRVTGFARTDRLVNNEFDRKNILKTHSLKDRKNVLLAPTWAQDDKGRSVVPFGAKLEDFFEALEKVGRKTQSNIIFRTHLNTGDKISVKKLEFVKIMPYTSHPFVEEFLYIADVLITDWSSIAIDYLALKRPTIFLDVPAPFSKGFTLGPEHRYGKVAKSLDELTENIEKYIKNPKIFAKEYKKNMENTIKVAYGDTLDGKARERYLRNLEKLLI